MLVPLAPRLLLLVLVSLQTHSTLFLIPALELVNAFIPENTLVLVALSNASQLLRTLGKHLLSPLLSLRRRKVKRRRLVLVPGHLLPLGSLPFPSTPKGRTHSMSWDNQVSAEESRGLASRVTSAPQAPLSTSLMLYGPNHGIAESSSQVEGGNAVADICDVTGDCDSLPQVSQQVTSDIVTPDITHDCDL